MLRDRIVILIVIGIFFGSMIFIGQYSTWQESQVEKERLDRESRERIELEKIKAAEKLETERLESLKTPEQREAERLEAERLNQQRQEQLESERLNQQRQEQIQQEQIQKHKELAQKKLTVNNANTDSANTENVRVAIEYYTHLKKTFQDMHRSCSNVSNYEDYYIFRSFIINTQSHIDELIISDVAIADHIIRLGLQDNIDITNAADSSKRSINSYSACLTDLLNEYG